ncbi:MAG: Fur family transcriptional regulator [Anaerolineales bacterium]|nr:Fur family transcriptional regulator [Anaerolineales bacterium]
MMNMTPVKDLVECWEENLRQNGYRVTRTRRQVMEIIAGSSTALTPREIYQLSLDQDRSLGMASVYRTVEMLEELDLIQQVHQPDGCHGIWPTVEGHKHYLICNACGRMEVVPGNEGITEYITQVEGQTGYGVEGHWLQLFGRCQSCQ